MGEGRGGEGRPGKGRWEMVWSAECVRDFNVVLHQTKSGTFVAIRRHQGVSKFHFSPFLSLTNVLLITCSKSILISR
jgi:hypothetical protein